MPAAGADLAEPGTAAQRPDAPGRRRDTARREPGTAAQGLSPADKWLARLRLPADHEAELAAEAESLAALGWPQLLAGEAPAAADEPAAGAGSGPPDGDLAWLACLPGALITEYADAAAVPPSREVLKAGFWDRSGHAGLGFASGGNADTLPPGPVLAGLAGRAWAGGLAALTDDELIGLLRAGRRLASWSAALELAAAGEVMGRRYAEAEATGDTRDAEHVGDEVAAALALTARSADRLTDLAEALWRLPGTAAALRAGRIDAPRAELIAAECTGLSARHAAAVEAEVLAAAPGLTTGQLRPVVRRAVIAADPAAALARKEQARKDARVERWAEHAGTAALAGRDLPPAAVLAADRHLTALAARLKAAGLAGTMDNLRASVYLCLLAGEPVSALLPGPAAADPADPAGEPLAPRSTGGGDLRRATALAGSVNRGGNPGPTDGVNRGGLVGSVNLTMPLATWLGYSEAPGEATGYGALDAADARSLAAALAARPGSRWCITLTDARGRPAAHGCARAGPTVPARGSTAQAGDSVPRGHPGPRRPQAPAGTEPAAGTGSSSATGTGSWSATVTITPLAAGRCDHDRETRAYQLSPALRHLIETRQVTCSFPGCRRPAVRCDKDHTIPYDQGGRTCECNCAPLCRRHHGAKQAGRWHLAQPQPGSMIWTTPSGRRYTTGPASYPL